MDLLSETLLSASELRSKEIEVLGKPAIVREPRAGVLKKYAEAVGRDIEEANGLLIAACLLNPDGTPAVNAQQASKVAQNGRVALPIVTAILEVSGFIEKEPDAG